MTSDHCVSAPQRSQQIIRWLIIAHVAIGIGAAFAKSYPNPIWGGGVLGIIAGQASLLGIWVGLGHCAWWRRLCGAVGGIGYLACLVSFDTRAGVLDHFVLLHSAVLGLATTMIAAVFLLAHLLRVVLQPEFSPASTTRNMRFSIRHLMLLTLVTACLLGIGRTASSHFDPSIVRGEILVAVVFAFVGLIPVGLLAISLAKWYGLVCVLIGVTAGNYFGLLWNAPWMQAFWVSVLGVESATVVVSLGALHYGGYRLKRLPRQQPTAMER